MKTDEKRETLSILQAELERERPLVDYFHNHVPEKELTPAMKLADAANRKAYEDKIQVYRLLEQEIIESYGLVDFHLTSPHINQGAIPVPFFTRFMNSIQKSVNLLGNTVKHKIEQGLDASKHIHASTALTLYAPRPGSFRFALGPRMNEKDSSLFEEKEIWKEDVLYRSIYRLLTLMRDTKTRQRLPDSWKEDSPAAMESVQDLLEEMEKEDLDLGIHWAGSGEFEHFTLSGSKDAARCARKIETFLNDQAVDKKHMMMTGTCVGLSIERHTLRFSSSRGKDTKTVHFITDDISSLLENGCDPLRPQECTMLLLDRSERKDRNEWHFVKFM